jgi:Cd2+/Zn2+-exporting ATPase
VALDSLTSDEVLAYAAAAERYSEHPLGHAIVEAASAAGLPVLTMANAQVLTGFGVRADCAGHAVLAGNRALLEAQGVAVDADADAVFADLERRGYTVAPVAVDGQVVGALALADSVRPTAAATVAALRRSGIRQTVMISGDCAPAVKAVAAQVGVDAWHAGVLPAHKLALIQQLRAGGNGVAYVGDGVNDAPALAAADVGVAMGAAGADVAIETAQVALMTDDIRAASHLLGLARETLRTIKASVVFSMSMNVLSLTLGMLGLIGPAAGALMHELSALPVLAYSARLVAYRTKQQVS